MNLEPTATLHPPQKSEPTPSSISEDAESTRREISKFKESLNLHLAKEKELGPYSDFCDYPDPLPDTCPKKEKLAHTKVLRDYSEQMSSEFSRRRLYGKPL